MSFHIILKHANNYLLTSIATKAIGFVSIPILTRLLSPSEYGLFNVFMTFVGLMIIIAPLNSFASIGRYWYEKQEDFNRFMGTSVYLTIICIAMFSLVFCIFTKQIGRISGLPENIVILTIPYVVVGIIVSIFRQVYQPQMKSKMIAKITVAKTYLGFGVGVCLMLMIEKNRYYGIIWGQLIVGILFSGIIIKFLLPYFKSAFERKHLKYILGYSVPLIPYALSGTILAQFDRIMINYYVGSSSTGLYSLAYNIGMLSYMLTGALLTAWIPIYFEDIASKNYKKLNSDTDKMFRLVLAGAMFLALFGEDIGKLIADEKYYSGLKIVPIIVFGYVFATIGPYWGVNIDYAKKPIWTSIVVFIAGLSNIGLNIVFIPKYGYIAGAYTTLTSYALMSFMLLIVTKYILKLYTVPVLIFIKPLLYCIFSYIFLVFTFSLIEINAWQIYGIKIIFLIMLYLLIARTHIKELFVMIKNRRR